MNKRILSILLAVIMVFTMIPLTAVKQNTLMTSKNSENKMAQSQ